MGAVVFVMDFWRKGIAAALPKSARALPRARRLLSLLHQRLDAVLFLHAGDFCGIMWIGSKLMPEPVKEEARLLIWKTGASPCAQAGGRGLGTTASLRQPSWSCSSCFI